MAHVTEYQNYTLTGVEIMKKYDFCDEIWAMIKEYMGVDTGIPLSFIPRFLRLTKTKMCGVSDRLISYNPQNGINLKTYKKNRLIKNILSIFFKEHAKRSLSNRNSKLLLAIDYMDK
jgi:hypothetical protein